MRRLLLFLSAFIGIGALLGAAMMFADPTGVRWGLDPILSILQSELPLSDVFFKDFVWSGIALLLINGLSNGVAFFALWRGKRGAWVLQLGAGVLLLVWLSVQWVIFSANVLTTLYTFLAFSQILMSLAIGRIKSV